MFDVAAARCSCLNGENWPSFPQDKVVETWPQFVKWVGPSEPNGTAVRGVEAANV